MTDTATMAEPEKTTEKPTEPIEDQPHTPIGDSESNKLKCEKVYVLDVKGREFKISNAMLQIGETENHPATRIVFEEPYIEWIVYFHNGKHHNVLRDEKENIIIPTVKSGTLPWQEDKVRNKAISDAFAVKNWKRNDVHLLFNVIEAAYFNHEELFRFYLPPQMGEAQNAEGDDERGMELSDYEYAMKILENNEFISNDGDELYIYQNGVYKLDNNGDHTDNEYTEMVLNGYSLQGSKCVLSKVARKSRTPPEYINPDPYIINFLNGLYDVRTDELSDHTSNYKSTVQIPHMYLDDASESEVINNIVKGILQEEDIPTFKEVCGYYMSLLADMKKNVFAVGKKDTGKTTLIEIIRNVVGNPQNCSAESLETLSKDRFSKYNLKDKLLNADDDVNDKTIFNTDIIKQLSGGSNLIRGEKKQQQAVMFKNTAKLLFAGNDLPPVFKDDAAYIERWIIFECCNVHKVTDKNALRKDEILDTITPQDYSAFIKECLDAFRGVLDRGHFTLSKSNQDIKHKYQILSNPLAVFIDECTKPGGQEIKTMFLKAYNNWAEKNNTGVITSSVMGRKMGGKGGLGYESSKDTVNVGVRLHFWDEISLTDEARREFVSEVGEVNQSNEDLKELIIKIDMSPGNVGTHSEKVKDEDARMMEELQKSMIKVDPTGIKVGQAVEGM